MVVWSVLFSLGILGYGSIPPARGSGTDMEPPVRAFSKCRPRVVVDGAARPRILQVPAARGSGWSRLASHFPSAARAW